MEPRQRLQWVKLHSARVFWPACIYDDYDTATDHTHDLSAVRTHKPVLDVEDRVVFFFGVRSAATSTLGSGIAASTTVVPNVRVCVVHENEIVAHVWDGADDFGHVCRTHHVPDETVTRVEQNSVFVRACSDAERFYEEAETDDDAKRLFMTFLMSMKTRSTSTTMWDTAPLPRPQATSSTRTARVEITKVEKKHEVETRVVNQAKTSVKPSCELKMTPELTELCWPLMKETGWTTFAMPDGKKIYIMPGVQFSQFRPNETVFEALDAACTKFLQEWAQSNTNVEGNDELVDCFWKMMAANGWQTITCANQVVYVMPNTPFDRFIPNETIFESKHTAISKFLAELGVEGQTQRVHNEVSDAQDSDTGSSANESEHETSQLDEGSSSDIEMSEDTGIADEESVSASDDESDDEDNEDSDDNQTVSRYSRHVRQTEKARENAAKPTRKRKGKVNQTPIRSFVPPFRLKQGLVERELEARGWYWEAVSLKKSADGYQYYKPHCVGKDDHELCIGRDYFVGYFSVEAYLKEFEPEIIQKLRNEHEAAYFSTNLPDVDVKKVVRRRTAPPPKRRLDVIVISDDDMNGSSIRTTRTSRPGSSRRKQARHQIKRYVAPQISTQDVKFGEVWRVLAEKGWSYRPGDFEYDYIKPTGKKKQDMIRGEDFFDSRSALEDYLKSSGLWANIADEIIRGIESYDEHKDEQATPVKRKCTETDDADKAHTPASKKPKVDNEPDFFTPPPPDRKKETPTTNSHEDIEQTQDLSMLTESTSQISPESTSSKSKKEDTQEGTQLARNLNSAFTPSPNAEKLRKPLQSSGQRLSAVELARLSVTKLSLSHQPSSFAHRESESTKIEDFCRACFAEERGGSLYLSGSPGCGKSALLRSLTEKLGQLHEEYGHSPNSIVPLHLNAMGVSDFTQVYCQAAQALMNKEFTDGDEAFEAIERGTKTGLKKSKTLVLVLDEIDALGKLSLENELCRLFELAHRPGHSFVLVGIANQIDFTERHLASLRMQLPNAKPQVIVFKPYSFQTINDILMDRLGGASASRIVNAHGVAFIARKVAAQSGDVRLALDICRRVLQQKLGELASSGSEDFGSPISLIDIVKTIKIVLEGKSKSNVLSLPRNLQMILFATTRLVAQTSGVDSSPASSSSDSSTTTHKLYHVDDLYECYCDVSHDAGVFKPLTRGEFKLGLETLSSEGMIGASELKKQLLKLLCTPSELLQAFKNDVYFSRLI